MVRSIPVGLRGLVAGLAAFALLAQVLFAAPLAVRMLADAPTCAAMADPGSDQAPSPAAPHTHALCLLCQGAAVPLALLAATGLLPLLLFRPWRAAAPRYVTHQAASRFRRYRSRAPPALA